MAVLIDKQLKDAYKQLRQGWRGGDRKLRILWRERCISCDGDVIVQQNSMNLELVWKVFLEEATDEFAIRQALMKHAAKK